MTSGPGANGPQRPAANDCGGGGFKHFQTVEGVQDGAAGHQHPVVFHEGHWVTWAHKCRHFGAVPKLLFKGDFAYVFQKQVALRDRPSVERNVTDGKTPWRSRAAH